MEYLFLIHPLVPVAVAVIALLIIYLRTKEQLVDAKRMLLLPTILFLFTIYRFFVGMPPTVVNILLYTAGLCIGALFWYRRALGHLIVADKQKGRLLLPADHAVVVLFAIVFAIIYLKLYVKYMHLRIPLHSQMIYSFDILCGLVAGSRLGQKIGYFHNYKRSSHNELQETGTEKNEI